MKNFKLRSLVTNWWVSLVNIFTTLQNPDEEPSTLLWKPSKKEMSKTLDIVQTGGVGSGGQRSVVRTFLGVFLKHVSEPFLGIIYLEKTKISEENNVCLGKTIHFFWPSTP